MSALLVVTNAQGDIILSLSVEASAEVDVDEVLSAVDEATHA